jgi:DNA repair ATPase RecN
LRKGNSPTLISCCVTASRPSKHCTGDRAVLGLLNEARANIAEIAAIDGSLAGMVETLGGICIQVEDAGLSMRDYSARIEADPHRLQGADDRLDLINRLKKKYAPTVENTSFKEKADVELVQLANRSIPEANWRRPYPDSRKISWRRRRS